jgi:hypothetical protein
LLRIRRRGRKIRRTRRMRMKRRGRERREEGRREIIRIGGNGK